MQLGEGESVTRQISDGRVDFQIVDALAEATGERPMDIPPLYESADLDALTEIVTDGDNDIRVEFEHVGCTVRIADGTITVTRKG